MRKRYLKPHVSVYTVHLNRMIQASFTPSQKDGSWDADAKGDIEGGDENWGW